MNVLKTLGAKMTDKQKFLSMLVETLNSHPDWMSDSITAIQLGVNIRLKKELQEKYNLAYALASFITHDNKRKFPHYATIQKALITLKKIFEGAEIEKDIDNLIDN